MAATKIFINATVLTVDDDFSVAEAVAIDGERILAVGAEEAILANRGPDTEIIDLQGKTLLPGFVEAHGHPSMELATVGPESVDIRPTVCNSADEVMQKLRDAVAGAKPGDWVTAFGWDTLLLPDLPTMSSDLLTELCPEIPFSVMHNSAHAAWANKAAMEKLGLTKDTPDPGSSEYLRDEDGELTGQAVEHPACAVLMGPAFQLSEEKFPAFLAYEMTKCNAVGVTTAGDLGFMKVLWAPFRAYADAGVATLRMRTYELSDAEMSSPRTPGEGDAVLRQVGIKVLADGSPWVGNIWTSFGYQDSQYTRMIGLEPGHIGKANYTPESLLELCQAYFAKGWQLAVHTHGDLTIDMVLDTFEKIQRDDPRPDARLRLEHCGTMTPAQFKRAASLDVTCSLFVDHIYYWGGVLHDFFGERGDQWTPAQAALDAGLKISFHNDPPVTPEEPLRNIQVAVTRKDRDGNVHAPEFAVKVEDAIRASTIWPAWQLQSEHEVGSIESGKLADFVVLGADPRTVTPDTIGDIEVSETWFAGKKVYSAS